MIQQSPFPLEGGRGGDGGDTADGRPAKGAVKRARYLRKSSTLAERLLWTALRALKQNIRRQVPIAPFVADFVHHASKLVIEIDGYYHAIPGAAQKDAARTAWLEAEGFRVLRFAEKAVRDDLHTVVERIASELAPPSPTLPPSRGKGVCDVLQRKAV
jgi:very-short-patch-repair endonuclease